MFIYSKFITTLRKTGNLKTENPSHSLTGTQDEDIVKPMEYDSNSKHCSFITHHNSSIHTAGDTFCGMFPDLAHCLFRSRNLLRCLTASSLALRPSFLLEVKGEMVCAWGLSYPTAKSWAAEVLWNWDCKLHRRLWPAPHCRHSQRTAQNGKNWVIHYQHIS